MADELLTAAEIARRAGVARSTVGDWIASKQLLPISSIKRGKGEQMLFSPKDAQPLIDRSLQKGSAHPEAIGGAAQ